MKSISPHGYDMPASSYRGRVRSMMSFAPQIPHAAHTHLNILSIRQHNFIHHQRFSSALLVPVFFRVPVRDRSARLTQASFTHMLSLHARTCHFVTSHIKRIPSYNSAISSATKFLSSCPFGYRSKSSPSSIRHIGFTDRNSEFSRKKEIPKCNGGRNYPEFCLAMNARAGILLF